jgi:hypothetical protein
LAAAVKDVAHIRALWKSHYGRVKRRRGDLSAEEIAAERWMVDVGAVRAGVSRRMRLRASSSPMPGAGGWPYED